MANRIWMVAALAAVFALCNLSGAQDKGGRVSAPSTTLKYPAAKVMAPKGSAMLETTRAIDIGAPGANDVVKDVASLTKMLQSLGLSPQEQGEGNEKLRYVVANNVVMIYDVNNGWVTFLSAPQKTKDPTSIPTASALGLMENSGVLAGWHFFSKYQTLSAWFGVEAAVTNQSVLKERLIELINAYNNSKSHLDQVLEPSK